MSGSDNETSWKEYLGMLIIGALNNLPYWVALSSAQAIVTNFNSVGLLGAITWGTVFFGVFATVTNTFLSSKNVSYNVRSIVNGCFMTFGLIGTAFATNIYVAIACIAFVGLSSDFGEGVMLGYFASVYNDSLMNAWGVGTGLSGILGSGYSFICHMLNVKYVTSFLALSPSGILYPLCFICLLNANSPKKEKILDDIEVSHGKGQMNDNGDGNPPVETDIVGAEEGKEEPIDDDNQLGLEEGENPNSSINFCSCRVWKMAFYFFINNGLTFFAQYASFSCFADCSMTKEEKIKKPQWYPLLNLCYQFGNALARSSLQFFQIKWVWLLTILQFVGFGSWWINVKYLYMDEWLQIVVMFLIGVVSGFSYVNVFNQAMNCKGATTKERELITNYTSISIAGFIVLSSIFTLLAQNTFLRDECIDR